jgi:hypothetical protein
MLTTRPSLTLFKFTLSFTLSLFSGNDLVSGGGLYHALSVVMEFNNNLITISLRGIRIPIYKFDDRKLSEKPEQRIDRCTENETGTGYDDG